MGLRTTYKIPHKNGAKVQLISTPWNGNKPEDLMSAQLAVDTENAKIEAANKEIEREILQTKEAEHFKY